MYKTSGIVAAAVLVAGIATPAKAWDCSVVDHDNINTFCEYGHIQIYKGGRDCFKVWFYESKDQRGYAIPYTTPRSFADFKKIQADSVKIYIFTDNVGNAIVTHGTKLTQCGGGPPGSGPDWVWYDVAEVYPDPYYP